METNGMSSDIENYVSVFVNKIAVSKVNSNLYTATSLWKPGNGHGMYGGQTISQALMAAVQTINASFLLHSAHSYFLRSGEINVAILYKVERVADGQNFSSRLVTATQNGKPILALQASFHKQELGSEVFLDYQPKMPIVKHHTELFSLEPGSSHFAMQPAFPVEIKPEDIDKYLMLKRHDNYRLLSWLRVCDDLGEEQNVHRCIASFILDWGLLKTSLTSINWKHERMRASLDYSLWFHKTLKMNEWVLYEAFSTQMHNGRTMCHGRLWSEDGQLLVSVAQEALVRGKL